MSDITHVVVKASLLPALDNALGGIFPLVPPLTPKGRYALAKAAKAVGPACQTYHEQVQAQRVQHAKKNDDGSPVTTDLGQGRVKYEMTPEGEKAFSAAIAAINDEDVSLPGVRMVSHAELGSCPITLQQEAALLGTLLIDEEPIE